MLTSIQDALFQFKLALKTGEGEPSRSINLLVFY